MAKGLERWFCVTGEAVVSAYTYVRATSAAEARRKVDGRGVVLAPHGVDRVGANPTEDAIVESADGSFRRRRGRGGVTMAERSNARGSGGSP